MAGRHRAYLLLGSNLDKERNLPAAVALLRPHGLAAVSRAFETAPVGTRHPERFLNAAVLLLTDLDPDAVKREICAAVERALGRERDPADRFAPRTIDLDLVAYDDAALDPDIVRYLHAARPLADLAPDLVHPADGRTMAAIADALETSADPAFFPVPRPDVMLSVRP